MKMLYSKFISRLIRILKSLLSNSQISDHRFQNKNQVTNSNIILYLLKKKQSWRGNKFLQGTYRG